MADLFDKYGVEPNSGKSGTPDLFDRYLPPPQPGVTAGGVQDFEPIAGRHIGTMELPKDEAAGWATTRIRKGLAGVAGMPRAASDLLDYGVQKAGAPDWLRKAYQFTNPITMAGQFMPSTEEINNALQPVLPAVNSPGRTGKIIDSAAESAVGGLALGGGAASILPSLAGGATSEFAGQKTEGKKWEPAARVLGGLVGGGAAAIGQNAIGSVVQGIRNMFPNVDETSAKILARAIERDQMTPNALAAAQAERPGSTMVEAGGPNVRGAVRGSIAAPGPARSRVENAFADRLEGSDTRTANALDSAISPNRSLATSVDEIATARAKDAAPKYRAAGIPDEIIASETTAPGATPPPRLSTILGPDGNPVPLRVSDAAGPSVTQRTFNTPNIDTPAVKALLADSKDVQQAIKTARALPQYKDLPDNSMVMLDKAYKHLGDMEREAVKAGSGERARDIGILRQNLKGALVEANPQYGEALAAYSGPSKLIDAAERGKEWFSKNVDPAIVAKERAAMSPEEFDSAMIGVRDFLNAKAGGSDRGIAAERIWQGPRNRERLQVLLPDYEKLAGNIGAEKNLIRTQRDIGVGSRTAPMAAEAADNAAQMGALSNLFKGRPLNALQQFMGPILEGRTEAVNARLAEIATMTDPKQVGLVAALANRAALEEAARSSGRMNALTYGTAAPAINALAGDRR